MKVNQSQFEKELAVLCGISPHQAKNILEHLKQLIYEYLSRGYGVEFSGFGQFMVSHRAAREGIVPKPPYTKAIIPAFNAPKFRAGQAFKRVIN